MPLWEYKILSSRQTPFASPQLLESFLNALGREQWEIISWQQAAGNALEFDAVLRRPTYREWHVDAPPPKPEEPSADEEAVEPRRGEFRELVLPENALAEDDESIWDDEDEDRPETIFDAVKPFLRRNPQGQGSSASVEFLANKCGATAEELLKAFAEEGLGVPSDASRRSAHAEHGGQYYWLNQNQRGQIWLNSKPKPALRPADEDDDEEVDAPPPSPAPAAAAEVAAPAPAAAPVPDLPPAELLQLPPESLLEKLRRMMRRNRRGAGYSGSVDYLARQLGTEGEALLAALNAAGLATPGSADDRLDAVPIGAYAYWLNRAGNGQIWINGKERRPDRAEPNAGGETLATDEAALAPDAAPPSSLPAAADAAPADGEHPGLEGLPAESQRAPDTHSGATGEDLVSASGAEAVERIQGSTTKSLPPSDAEPDASGEGGPQGEDAHAAHVADPAADAAVGTSGEAVVDVADEPDLPADTEERDASADAAWLAGLRARLDKGERRGEVVASIQVLADQLGSSALDLIDRLAKAGIGQPGDDGERAALAVAEGWAYWLSYEGDVLQLHARERAAMSSPRRSSGGGGRPRGGRGRRR